MTATDDSVEFHSFLNDNNDLAEQYWQLLSYLHLYSSFPSTFLKTFKFFHIFCIFKNINRFREKINNKQTIYIKIGRLCVNF